MVRIYYVHSEYLPASEQLLRYLPEAWRQTLKNHVRSRRENSARASLAGFLLLHWAGCSAPLHFLSNGRPAVFDETFDFNISHTARLTVCAVRFADPHDQNTLSVGIDAEDGSRLSDRQMQQIAQRWFSPKECALSGENSDRETFLRIWTGKEAMVKRTGAGLRDLRTADTLSVPQDLLLRHFDIGQTVICVCSSCEEVPEEPICMDAELLSAVSEGDRPENRLEPRF